MTNTSNKYRRKYALPKESIEGLHAQHSEEETAKEICVLWATQAIWDFASSLNLPGSFITAALLNCFTEAILDGEDKSKILEDKARFLIGVNCLEAVDKALEKSRRRKGNE